MNRTLLKDGIANANIPALLMVLYQMTGEATWLQEPFAPGRSPGSTTMTAVGSPTKSRRRSGRRQKKRSSRLAGKPLAIERLNLIAEMLSVAMTEHVPEYGDIVAAGMGYDLEPTAGTAIAADKTAIVIGGRIGICAGIELGKLGIDYTLFEKNEDFEETWFENRYPGCSVDTPSLHSPCRPNDWSYFPLRDESRLSARYHARVRTIRQGPLPDACRRGALEPATDQWDVPATDGKRNP